MGVEQPSRPNRKGHNARESQSLFGWLFRWTQGRQTRKEQVMPDPSVKLDKRIRLNQVRCLQCGDLPVSLSDHDFRSCKCGNVSVDGGRSYLRRVFKTKEWEEISQYE